MHKTPTAAVTTRLLQPIHRPLRPCKPFARGYSNVCIQQQWHIERPIGPISKAPRCGRITGGLIGGMGSWRHQIRCQSTSDTTHTKQAKTPWHREGSDQPPVRRLREAGAMTKGKLLTTPSRLLKLILPLTTSDKNVDRKDVEPLALLVHPQQPLSYLERLIQSELPPLPDGKVPYVHFRAQDVSQEEAIKPKAPEEKKDKTPEDLYDEASEIEDGDGKEEVSIGGEKQSTGKISSSSKSDSSVPPPEPKADTSKKPGSPPPGPLSSSQPKPLTTSTTSSDSDKKKQLIRWSPSTEIADFIRDAAISKEFAVEIEGQEDSQILVSVPSFNDRTHFLRQRLRATAKKISSLNTIKSECDQAAHKSAQHVALGGGGLLAVYWGGVYYLTFQTDYGWDVMEPVTYLIGLSCIISGYLWFLWHNREVSYRAAMKLTVSRRRAKLYEAKGFDFSRWESLIEEANHWRGEVRSIAREYDVEWDEMEDERDEGVARAMRKMRQESGDKKGKGKDGEDGDD